MRGVWRFHWLHVYVQVLRIIGVRGGNSLTQRIPTGKGTCNGYLALLILGCTTSERPGDVLSKRWSSRVQHFVDLRFLVREFLQVVMEFSDSFFVHCPCCVA